MKYNKELLEISAKLYSNTNIKTEVNNDEETTKLQNELLKILIKRLREHLKEDEQELDGILKIRFKDRFWQDSDEGYSEIKKLVDSQKFDTFASKYCIYLGNIEDKGDEHYATYHEVVWDYRTYFESLSMAYIQDAIKNKISSSNQNKYIKALYDFKQLPLEYQLEVLESFTSTVEKSKNEFAQDETEKKCLTIGHEFDEWKHNKWSTYKDIIIDHQLVPNYKEEHESWSRTCIRCGAEEEVKKEPKELIEARAKRKKKARIKKLEAELRRLKEEE